MPRQDGTGPQGLGAGTGRGLGPCGAGAGFARGAGFGRGMGRGMGFGRGWRCGCPFLQAGNAVNANLSKEDEKKILEAELKEIETEKEAVVKRLKELK